MSRALFSVGLRGEIVSKCTYKHTIYWILVSDKIKVRKGRENKDTGW